MNLLPKKTLAGILSSFQRTLDDLEAHTRNKQSEVDDLTVDIEELVADRNAAADEASRASGIAANLRKLLEA